MCAKSIPAYGFSTFYTKLAHDKLKSNLSSTVDLAFKGGDKTFMRLFNNAKAYWGKKTKKGAWF